MILKYFATLNENNICIGTQSTPLEQPLNSVEITEQEYQNNAYIYKKYENGVWSTEKFEPTSTAPIDEFEQLKQNNATLSQTLGNVTLENANLKQQVETLTQTVANLMVGGTN